MSEKKKQKFEFRGVFANDLRKNKYNLHLQKAKYHYFNEQIKSNRQIRKNSGVITNFKIFKIRRKNKLTNQR